VDGIASVSGGSRGIGAATSTLLATKGWDVVVAYHQEAEAAQSVVKTCHEEGRRATALPVDVSSEDSVTELFSTVDRELGIPRALINCAGIVDQKARLDELTAALRLGSPGEYIDYAASKGPSTP
jgi:NAD(P)-dependent dehydrogenase (short-subunit alcohol dehydrogenase family)